eukprot:1890222-Pleurochrysis_carterae.AAC.1
MQMYACATGVDVRSREVFYENIWGCVRMLGSCLRTSSADSHARSRHARAAQHCSGKDLHTQAAETCVSIYED